MVNLFDEFGVVELAGALDAPGDACAVVEEFGEGLGESIGDGFDHDGFVGVVLGFEFVRQFVGAVDADDETAEVIGVKR